MIKTTTKYYKISYYPLILIRSYDIEYCSALNVPNRAVTTISSVENILIKSGEMDDVIKRMRSEIKNNNPEHIDCDIEVDIEEVSKHEYEVYNGFIQPRPKKEEYEL